MMVACVTVEVVYVDMNRKHAWNRSSRLLEGITYSSSVVYMFAK